MKEAEKKYRHKGLNEIMIRMPAMPYLPSPDRVTMTSRTGGWYWNGTREQFLKDFEKMKDADLVRIVKKSHREAQGKKGK